MNNIVENVPFPFPMYNAHFKVICVLEDKIYYKKLKVKCVNCPGTKELTIDTRSNSNIRKHLSVSTGQYSILVIPTYILSLLVITIIIHNWLFLTYRTSIQTFWQILISWTKKEMSMRSMQRIINRIICFWILFRTKKLLAKVCLLSTKIVHTNITVNRGIFSILFKKIK